MERLRSAAVICATLHEKPAFRISRWISSMHEVGGSRGLGNTSLREVEPAGSKPSETVPPREEPADLLTIPSEAIVEL